MTEFLLTYEGREYAVEATTWRDPGQPRSYSSGGSPPEAGIDEVRVTDEDGNDVTPRYEADDAFARAVDDAIWRHDDEDHADADVDWGEW